MVLSINSDEGEADLQVVKQPQEVIVPLVICVSNDRLVEVKTPALTKPEIWYGTGNVDTQ